MQSTLGYTTEGLRRSLALMFQLRLFKKLGRIAGLEWSDAGSTNEAVRLALEWSRYGSSQSIYCLAPLVQGAAQLASSILILLLLGPVWIIAASLSTVVTIITLSGLGMRRLDFERRSAMPEAEAMYFTSLLATPMAIKETRLYELSSYFIRRFRDKRVSVDDEACALAARELRANLALSILPQLTSTAVLVSVGISAIHHTSTIGDVTLMLGAMTGAQVGLGNLAKQVTEVLRAAAPRDYFEQVLALPEKRGGALRASDLRNGIEFRDVWFHYPGQEHWILKGCDLRIRRGQTVAVVGLNGAGKSTLVKLLLRLYEPDRGCILWDGIDIRELDLTSLRDRIAATFQDFAQFALTARENIGVGDPKLIERLERVQRAARLATIHEALDQLPAGYDTVLSRWLGQTGNSGELSIGQWQKVALARMMFRDADLFVLDEPTASLDAAAEREVLSTWLQLIGSRTCLVVSHRIGAIRRADMVAVLEHGRITGFGTHSELLNSHATYQELYGPDDAGLIRPEDASAGVRASLA